MIPGVVSGLGHARRGDATRAVEGGEDLGEVDHPPADARLALDDDHPPPTVREIEGRLQAGDAGADDQDVGSHAAPPASSFSRASRMPSISLR